MAKIEILRGDVITPYEMRINSGVVIKDGLISEIISGSEIPEDAPVTVVEEGYILPGLVDIHNHGGAGFDYMDSSDYAYSQISMHLASHGVTTALATTITAPIGDIINCLQSFRTYSAHSSQGCRLVGIHLEGPFLSVQNKGAHPEHYLRTPHDGYNFILDNADIIKIVTVSPELDGMCDMIYKLRSVGIVVSGGHDNAVDYEIVQAIDAGMTHTTHIYCAMSTLSKRGAKRHVGLCEIAMTDDRLTIEMIADNNHIPPVLAKMIYKCKGADKLCLVSDCIRAGGMAHDEKPLYLGLSSEGGQPIIVEDGVAMLPDKSRFAGSIQSLDSMIRNVVLYAGVPIHDAVRMATLTPATVIGMQKEIGSIEIGKRADLCIMDKDFRILRTILDGQTIFAA